MVPFDFAYYRPESIAEAVALFTEMEQKGRRPLYYGGGTEIITLSRLGFVSTAAVIDIKAIPECRVLDADSDPLVLGAALSLTELEEANPFPLLTKTAKEVADRTARNQITLGGNLCGQIFYRETALALLVAEADIIIAGPDGVRQSRINDLFHQQLQLGRGEFVVQVKVRRSDAELPHFHHKRRKQGEIGYPLVTIAALKKDEAIHTAFSGVCPFPFRSADVEAHLNDRSRPAAERIRAAVSAFPRPILHDIEGSADYRLFVAAQLLEDALRELGETI
ncbi:xanthine dehydrogenase [Geobacillus subterraneus]|uniref:Xanthine dehydrogenase n=2 Tax=Geobacillus TaxID=129337 RepID=A0ABN4NNW6_9BACL|nr:MULTISPECIES: FAD binding domain-containing protein [Geobacillus]AMX84621.1 xanthine dehydrogenase [Geobacillus subterraneus]KZS24823.1 xanthine dehydrogenase [Geobacillus subterraneus]OXB85443.1 xanthine dehydrogenase [Geobacillus uzenensis]QIZ66556.1 xanthine dehydrogenase [Geobacillus subterraneus]WPZ18771.1 FAD binding domain-containing protein [Geobacillus subterraneus]